jgi:hypothetical protein
VSLPFYLTPMKISISHIGIMLILAFACACHSSRQVFVTASGQPIPPLALAPLFPSPVSGASVSVVDVGVDTGHHTIILDSSTGIATKGPWFRSYSAPDTYLDYKIAGKKKNGDFVLIARSVSGTYTQVEVMVIRYKGQTLNKITSFEPGNIRDYPVIVNGNSVLVDSSGAKKKTP